MLRYEGKIVWITGASSGIGEALVYLMAGKGAKIIASSNCKKELSEVRDNCGSNKENVHIVCFDLSDTSNINNLVEEQINIHKHIDILINLGGISTRATIVDSPIDLDRQVMEINYFGTIALTKAILPYMIKQKDGHILATSSISGRFGFPLRSAYSASKQALHGFFETLHLENKTNNVRASVIIPGRVRTNISYHALTASGKEHGKLDDGQAKGITAKKAAIMIEKGIRKNKREILVGSKELIMLYIRKLFPAIFFNIASKLKAE